LIDEFIQYLKKNSSYEAKKLLNNKESELIEKILTLARECLRDNLVKKLINLWSLSLETSYKPSKLREEVHKKMKSYLSNSENIKRYKERLQKKEINDFYNLSDIDFRNLLKEKNGIINKCQ
jgi:hypothetical protein